MTTKGPAQPERLPGQRNRQSPQPPQSPQLQWERQDETPPDRDHIVLELRSAGCVFAEEEADLLIAEAADSAHLTRMLGERVRGTPLEHVLGWAEFAGLRILVDRGVFVPRRRTMLLARQAVELSRPGDIVVDLCCGSGAVGAAIAAAVPGNELHAADVEPAAVACARRNLEPRGASVHEGDLYGALPAAIRGRVRVLAVNAPYVPTGEIGRMPPEAREHEPMLALDGGGDGLDVHRRVAADAAGWLAPGGSVVIETSSIQAPVTADLFAQQGMTVRVVTDDDLDATVVVATAPEREPSVPR
jgi:release factor glutamine methyltransferase